MTLNKTEIKDNRSSADAQSGRFELNRLNVFFSRLKMEKLIFVEPIIMFDVYFFY